MNALGHSGAKVEIFEDYVLKTHNEEIYDEARYCAAHPEVFPRVIGYFENPPRYTMERLQEVQPNNRLVTMMRAITLARAYLWLPLPNREQEGVFNLHWSLDLAEWARQHSFTWITSELIRKIHPEAPVDEAMRAEYIHGDFTLANIMRRGDKIVMIDPRPPKGKVPAFREVDYGKMMQSALGWEAVVTGTTPERDNDLVDLVYRQAYIDKINPRRVEFWAAVSLARVIPYAKDQHIRDWAEIHSRRIADAISLRS